MNQIPKKVLLVDGSNIAFRMYFALERLRLTSPDGRPSWAIYGFLKALFEIIQKEKPTVAIACFDAPGKTFRHEMADFYKANRNEMPEDLRKQWPEIQRGLKLLGFEIMAEVGLEADDLIGTLASRGVEAGWEVDILSGDKDNFQLVQDGLQILYPVNSGGVIKIDQQAVIDKLGVHPNQVIDFKALSGDSSDNIPGVAGVGEKTAQNLLKQFQTLEDIYNNLDQVVSNSVRNKLEKGRESAFLSKTLATIKLDCQINFDYTKSDYVIKPNKN